MMMGLQVVQGERKHIRMVAELARPEDIAEVKASCGKDIFTALNLNFHDNVATWAAFSGDDIVCLAGVNQPKSHPHIGVPWMIGTVHLDEHALSFLRENKSVIEEMRQHFAWLVNFVDARNEKAIRWLQFLGFQIHDPIPWGVEQLPFHKFDMRGEKPCAIR